MIVLGALGAGETKTGEVELTPPDGISVAHHPIDVLAASGGIGRSPSGSRARGRLAARGFEIGVERVSPDLARVT